MLQKNKVIDQIVKKLLLNDFPKEDIFALIDLHKNFNSFENYIYYLLLLSNKSYNSPRFKMCSAINSYLVYLVQTFDIKQINIEELPDGACLCNEELFVIGVKGYGSDKHFYFDVDDNLFILLNNVEHIKYQQVINLKYNDGFLKSKTNSKIFNQQFNNIYVFVKDDDKNVYLGKYVFLYNGWIYINKIEYYSFLICKEDYQSADVIEQFENLNNRMRIEALDGLKHELSTIVMSCKNIDSKLLQNIKSSTCHLTLIDAFVQFCLLNNEINLLSNIVKNQPELFARKLKVHELIPHISTVNEYQLSLFANSYDILKGSGIVSDYLQNVYICNDNITQEEDGTISLRFVKSCRNHFFDLKINKIIFNTINLDTVIYLFEHKQGKYFFLGIYKCFKINVGYDLKNRQTPIFKLKKISQIDYLKHINYLNELEVDNSYKNVFLKILNTNPQFNMWSKQVEIERITSKSVKMDHLNSLLYKYNWITNKCIKDINDNLESNKNIKLYQNFDSKNMKALFNVLSNNFLTLCDEMILKPHTIAYEMTRNNWSNKELFALSYIDYYLSKHDKYQMIKNIYLQEKTTKTTH